MKLPKLRTNEIVFATGAADWHMPKHWRETVSKLLVVILAVFAILYVLPQVLTALVMLAEGLSYLLI